MSFARYIDSDIAGELCYWQGLWISRPLRPVYKLTGIINDKLQNE